MQQGITPGDVERQDVDFVLASYGQRVGAWALDFVGSILTKLVLVTVFLALFLRIILSGLGSAFTVFAVPDWPNTVLAIAAVVVVAGIGYIVWWLLVLGRDQTPGNQIVGIRVFKDNGEPSGWGDTFLREFVVKSLLLGFLSHLTFGIAWVVDCLWPLWDRTKRMQTLHDKLLGTVVVRVE